MKKILSLILVLVLVFSVVACKSNDAAADGIKTELSKTKEGALTNSLMLNNLDVKKQEASFEFKMELKPGLVSMVPNLPFKDKEAVEKIIVKVVNKIGFKGSSISSYGDKIEGMSSSKLTYGDKDFLNINLKFDGTSYYYYIPELFDKTIVTNIKDMSKDLSPQEIKEQDAALNTVKALFDIKNNDKDVNAALKATIKNINAEVEKYLTSKSLVAEPEDAELELKSGKIKVKKYTLDVKLSQLPDFLYEVLSGLKSNPEFKTNVLKLTDTLKVALEKDDRYKDLYVDKEKATKEDFEKGFEELKAALNKFFDDEKALDQLKDSMGKNKKDLANVDAMLKMKLIQYLDDRQIARGQEVIVDSPFVKFNMIGKIEALNNAVKEASIEMGKEELVYSVSKAKEFNKYMPEIRENFKKIIDGEAYQELIKDLKDGVETLEGQDKMMLQQLLFNLEPEQLKNAIDTIK